MKAHLSQLIFSADVVRQTTRIKRENLSLPNVAALVQTSDFERTAAIQMQKDSPGLRVAHVEGMCDGEDSTMSGVSCETFQVSQKLTHCHPLTPCWVAALLILQIQYDEESVLLSRVEFEARDVCSNCVTLGQQLVAFSEMWSCRGGPGSEVGWMSTGVHAWGAMDIFPALCGATPLSSLHYTHNADDEYAIILAADAAATPSVYSS